MNRELTWNEIKVDWIHEEEEDDDVDDDEGIRRRKGNCGQHNVVRIILLGNKC